MATDDLKQHIHSTTDFYDLLGVAPVSSESEIRRAYRKTALKYHPDKVGPANQAALDKFHLLQIAYDVLSDATVRELYDNARRAREEKREREAAYEGRRKWMKEDLERREAGAVKRKREEVDEEEAFETELRRLAEDGRKRRKLREEALRQEALAQENDEVEPTPLATSTTTGGVDEMDRSITLRFLKSDSSPHLTAEYLTTLFSRFGPISDVVLRDKKLKPDGSKHRQLYTTAVLLFNSVVGAHAAVSDLSRIAQQDERFAVFEAVGWARGREPDFIPKPAAAPTPTSNAEQTFPINEPRTPLSKPKFTTPGSAPAPQTAPLMNGASDGLKRVPSFSSFKATLKGAGQGRGGTPSLDELTMMRLKNAEKRRIEEKLRREEEVAAREEQEGLERGSGLVG